jgi:hypothetical protein
MQITILITGIIAAILFILSGISFIFKWGNFKIIAVAFLAVAIAMFILMIIRNLKEYWTIGGNKPKEG